MKKYKVTASATVTSYGDDCTFIDDGRDLDDQAIEAFQQLMGDPLGAEAQVELLDVTPDKAEPTP